MNPAVSPSRELVRWDIVEEHLDEAEFLVEMCSDAVVSPVYTLAELQAGPEQRLAAHLDALVIGGDTVADRLLWPELSAEAEAPLRVAAAAHAILAAGQLPAIERLLQLVSELPSCPAREGITRALSASGRLDLSARLLSFAEHSEGPGHAAMLGVVGERGGLPGPKTTRWIAEHVGADDPSTRAVCVRCARFSPRALALSTAEPLLLDADPSVQIAAMHTALIHGSHGVLARVVDLTTGRVQAAPEVVSAAMLCTALLGEPAHVEALAGRLQDPALRADAIWALGFSGRARVVDELVPLLADEAHGRLAAEAVVGIIGLSRTDDRYWVEPEAEPPPTDEDLALPLPDEDLDADLGGAPEDDLPLPNVDEIVRFWAEAKPRFDPKVRFLEGRPARGSAYAEVMTATSTRRRHALALEIAIRTRGAHHIPTRGLASQQRPAIDALAGLVTLDGNLPYSRIS